MLEDYLQTLEGLKLSDLWNKKPISQYVSLRFGQDVPIVDSKLVIVVIWLDFVWQ